MGAAKQMKPKKSLQTGAVEQGRDLRKEVLDLEVQIENLKTEYEQFFLGIRQMAPEQLHTKTKAKMRQLRDAPFRNAEVNFKIRNLDNKFQTYNSYWQRVLREKEAGTYKRDLFKAELHERLAAQEEKAKTTVGAAERGINELYRAFKSEVEKVTGKKQELDYDNFKKSLVARAKDLKSKHGVTKVSFKVSVEGDQVKIKAVGSN